jgi:hypothetical protein
MGTRLINPTSTTQRRMKRPGLAGSKPILAPRRRPRHSAEHQGASIPVNPEKQYTVVRLI